MYQENFQSEHKNLAKNCSLETIVKKGLQMSDYHLDISKEIENMPK